MNEEKIEFEKELISEMLSDRTLIVKSTLMKSYFIAYGKSWYYDYVIASAFDDYVTLPELIEMLSEHADDDFLDYLIDENLDLLENYLQEHNSWEIVLEHAKKLFTISEKDEKFAWLDYDIIRTYKIMDGEKVVGKIGEDELGDFIPIPLSSEVKQE